MNALVGQTVVVFRSADPTYFIAHVDGMRFAARESAIFGQPETGFGLIPGGGGIQHLSRLRLRTSAASRSCGSAARSRHPHAQGTAGSLKGERYG